MKSKTVLICLVVIVCLIALVVIFLNNNDKSETSDLCIETDGKEPYKTIEVAENGATLLVYDSVPVTVIEAATEHIINKQCNQKEITFVFKNSESTFAPDFPSYSTGSNFIYYVAEMYFDTYIGFFAISKKGSIEESNILPESKISFIRAVTDIGWKEAVNQARKELGISIDVGVHKVNKKLITLNGESVVLCYEIMFDNRNDMILIDSANGARING